MCMVYGDTLPDVACVRRRRPPSHEPEPLFSDSLKKIVLPAESVVELSCTCSSGTPIEQARPLRSVSARLGDVRKTLASASGIDRPKRIAAGSITAGLELDEGFAVPVADADAPAVMLAVGVSLSGGVAVAVAEGKLLGVRVRASVRVKDEEGVPVWLGEDVLDSLGVTGGVVLPLLDGVLLAVSEGVAPADIVDVDIPVSLGVPAPVADGVDVLVSAGV